MDLLWGQGKDVWWDTYIPEVPWLFHLLSGEVVEGEEARQSNGRVVLVAMELGEGSQSLHLAALGGHLGRESPERKSLDSL
jgi:hypothetical protein